MLLKRGEEMLIERLPQQASKEIFYASRLCEWYTCVKLPQDLLSNELAFHCKVKTAIIFLILFSFILFYLIYYCEQM